MRNGASIFREKLLLSVSGVAFLLLLVPAWLQGLVLVMLAGGLWIFCVFRIRILTAKPFHGFSSPGLLLAGICVVSGFGCNFYSNWRSVGALQRVASLLGTSPGILAFEGAFLLAAAAMPAVVCVGGYYMKLAREDYRGCAREGDTGGISLPAAAAILFGIYLLGISAILRAYFYYQDDAGRVVFGYKQWDYFGRFLSTAFATVVHTDHYLVDVAPLSQLLAILIAAFSAVLVLYILLGRTRFTLWELLAAVPIGLNPYFLECISFRYDAPYMAIALLCAVFPLLFRNRTTGAYLFAAAVGTVGVCTSYQVFSGVFPTLVVVIALQLWNRGMDGKKLGGFLLKSVGGYLLGLLFFKLVLMRPAAAGYVSNALPAGWSLITNTAQNLKTYYKLVLSDFRPLWLMLTGLLGVLFVVLPAGGSVRSTGARLLAGALSLAALALMSFGLYPALQNTLFAPRAMCGFGVLLGILGICAAQGTGRSGGKAAAVILSWCFFVFAFSYGEALNLQKEYTEFRIQAVVSDLSQLPVRDAEERIPLQLVGGIGKTPLIANRGRGGAILERLVPKTFGGADDLLRYRFFYHYGLENVFWDDSANPETPELPVWKNGLYHTICRDGQRVVVILK